MAPRQHGYEQPPAPRPTRMSSRTRMIAGTSALLLMSGAVVLSTVGQSAGASTSTTVTLAPVADTYVTSGAPTGNYGAAVNMQASAESGHLKTAFLRFQIPAYAGKQLTSAALTVTRDNHHLNSTVYANTVSSSAWSESTTTAKTAPAVGAVLDSQNTNSTTSTVTFAVTKGVALDSNASLALTSKSTTDFASFRTKEWGTGAPKLVLTLEPIPVATSTPPEPVSSIGPATSTTAAATSCVSDPMGIPSSGAYVGATVSGTAGDLAGLEKQTGMPVAIHRTYFSASQVANAITTVKADLAAGRLPWISFKLPYSWADMANGRGDAWATDLADKLAAVGGPVWVAFHHEPEGDGPIQDWKRMQQHLAPIIHAHAKNVAYTIIIMTWDLFGDAQYRPDLIWPGDQYVDVLGLDMYNDYGTNRNGNTNIPMLDPMKYFGYFGPWAKSHHVPWALAETGYTTAAAGVNPDWLKTEYQELSDNGGIGLAYFDSSLNSIADWTLDLPSKLGAFTGLLKQSPRICR